jgi:DNA-binding MarR family transcriptional regulator
VQVTVDGADKRSRRLGLTEAGRTALADAVPLWQQAQIENQERVSNVEPDRLRGALRALS